MGLENRMNDFSPVFVSAGAKTTVTKMQVMRALRRLKKKDAFEKFLNEGCAYTQNRWKLVNQRGPWDRMDMETESMYLSKYEHQEKALQLAADLEKIHNERLRALLEGIA